MRRVAFCVVVSLLALPAAGVAHRRVDERVRQVPSKPRAVTRPPVRTPVVPATPPKPRPLARVQATTREFSITLSRRTLPAGRVAVELANRGEDPHDLRVERADAPTTGFSFTLAKPGTVASQKVELAPGEWKLYCTLEGHAAAGMSTTVTVTG